MLLVLWYHIWEISWLPAPLKALQFIPETGFVGVDLFFFISGFVIVYPFVRAQWRGEPRPTWVHFFYRRGMKIVPSYVLSIVVVIAIGYAHFSSVSEAASAIVTHLLFIHTWWSGTYGTINGVLWTLAVEVQFYVVFPLVWWSFSRRPWLTAMIMIAASLIYRSQAQMCCLQTHAEQLIENLPGYLDIFAFGMIGAYLFVRRRETATTMTCQTAATLAALVGFFFFTVLLQNLWSVRLQDQWSTVWQVHNRTLVGLAFLVMGLGSLLALPVWQRTIANPVLLFFGVVSYNLYLYHQALARELLAWRFPGFRGDPHHDPHWQIAYTVVSFAATMLFAATLTYAFERPLLRVPMERWKELRAPKLS